MEIYKADIMYPRFSAVKLFVDTLQPYGLMVFLPLNDLRFKILDCEEKKDEDIKFKILTSDNKRHIIYGKTILDRHGAFYLENPNLSEEDREIIKDPLQLIERPKSKDEMKKYNKKISDATVRAEYFASSCAKLSEFFPSSFIFILDGFGRNIDALIDNDIDPQRIFHFEMKKVIALYHKIRYCALQHKVRHLYNENGYQEIVKRKSFENVVNNTMAFYADFCGKFPADFDYTIDLLRPSLVLLGITCANRVGRGERKTKTLVYNNEEIKISTCDTSDFGSPARKFNHGTITCNFYILEAYKDIEGVSDNTYEIEKILDEDIDDNTGKTIYLVKWSGYSKDHNTWEDEDYILPGAQKLLDKFRNKN